MTDFFTPGTINSTSVTAINTTYSTLPINKDGLESGYITMTKEIPDEIDYYKNPNNETKPSFFTSMPTETSESSSSPSSFLHKYLKYKNKYLKLKKIFIEK